MIQEDKDLLLTDLCGRLPYGLKLQNINDKDSIVQLRSINLDNYCYEIQFYTYQGKALTICNVSKLFRFGKILRYKPYLFPMSSMTEEQYKTYCELEHSGNMEHLSLPLLEWLNKNHFDYRGLIEKGLAIDATNLNIY
jgi:hypothetical protein